MIEQVADYDNGGGAIGYSVYYYASLMYQKPELRILSVNDVEPSAQSIKDGSYPLLNDFYLVIRKDEPVGSAARQLRDWILSDNGRQAFLRIRDTFPSFNISPPAAENLLRGTFSLDRTENSCYIIFNNSIKC